MNPASNVLVHVGHFKTATTWLQEKVFCEPSLGFFVPPTLGPAGVRRLFCAINPYTFEPEAVAQTVRQRISDARRPELVPVLSDEHLSGNPTHGYYHGHEVAIRLQRALPESRILIGIRRQKPLLLSLYQQYVKTGGRFRLDEFFGRREEEQGGAKPLCRLDHLEFHFLSRHYQELFGNERVLVLPLELLRRDPVEYIRTLQSFAGAQGNGLVDFAPVNRSLQGATLEMRRYFNRVTQPRPLGRPASLMWRASGWICRRVDPLIPQRLHDRFEGKLRAAIEARVGDHYRASNRTLEKLTGINLGELGYD